MQPGTLALLVEMQNGPTSLKKKKKIAWSSLIKLSTELLASLLLDTLPSRNENVCSSKTLHKSIYRRSINK